MILTLKNKKHPIEMNPMNANMTIVLSDFYPNPIAELMISVVMKVKNKEAPLRMPVT